MCDHSYCNPTNCDTLERDLNVLYPNRENHRKRMGLNSKRIRWIVEGDERVAKNASAHRRTSNIPVRHLEI